MLLRQKFRGTGLYTLGGIALGLWLVAGIDTVALSQDQSVATPKDEISARKTLMDSIDTNMNALEGNSGQPFNLDQAQDRADAISSMLMAFPYLFPPSTNQWKPNVERDPAADTYASPDAWTKFPDFYHQAMAASKLAYDASRAKKEDDFRKSVAALRLGCNACHSAYLKTDQ
jgi:cytochrome c556